MGRHWVNLARTALVKNNDVEKSFEVLQKALNKEKIFTEGKRRMYNEKPYIERNRICYERCKRIYNEEMKRKIRFLMRTNRVNPFPR